MNIFLHSYGDFKCNKDWVVEKDACCFSRVYYVKRGDATYFDDEQKVNLKVNHLYIFPQNKKYGIFHNVDNKLETLYFHVTTLKPIERLIDYDVNSKEDKLLIEMLTSNINGARDFLEILLQALLFKPLSKEENQVVYDDEIQKVLTYIQDNVFDGGEINVSKLAEKAFYSESYLIKKFKKSVGMTPTQYIINLKLEKVADSMGSMPIKSLALKFGFNDYKNFSNLFKKKFGISPNSYQEIKIQSKKMTV